MTAAACAKQAGFLLTTMSSMIQRSTFGRMAGSIIDKSCACTGSYARWARPALGLAVLTLASGCSDQVLLQVESFRFNDRIRTDREPLTPEQQQVDRAYGVFSTATDDLIAELYPDSMEGAPDNLPLSGCLWLGHEASPSGGGDLIAMSWEAIANFRFSDGEPWPENGEPVAACRFNHPVSAQALAVDTNALTGGGSVTISDSKSALTFGGGAAAFNASDPLTPFQEDMHILFDTLTQFSPTAAEVDSNIYSACPSQPFTSNANPVRDLFGGNCPVGNDGNVTACGNRCRIRPYEDASFMLGTPGNASTTETRVLPVDVMVVRGERRLARPMTQSGAVAQWSVTVETDRADPSRLRWSENFSENLSVASLRFFDLVTNGSEQPLTVTGNRLCIKASDLDPPGACRWSCTGVTTPTGGTVFDLRAPNACAGPTGAGLPALTPAYDTDLLEPIPGQALERPLQWEVSFVAGAAVTNPHIDFTVVDDFGPAALTVEPALMDFGRVPLGDHGQRGGRIRNIGSQVMRIDQVAIVGAAAAEYQYHLPTGAVPVPIPVETEVIASDKESNKLSASQFRVSVGTDFRELPLLTMRESESLRVISPPALDGEVIVAYGEPLTFSGNSGFYTTVGMDFLKASAMHGHGERRLVQNVFRNRMLPFTLAPGESADLLVTSRPTAWAGRDAALRVDATALTGQATTLRVEQALTTTGISGPELAHLPRTLVFGSGANPWSRVAFVQNVGSLDLTRLPFYLTGADAAKFRIESGNPTHHTLVPGDFEDFEVSFKHYCVPVTGRTLQGKSTSPRQYQAELIVPSNGGNATIALVAPEPCPL